MAKEKASNFEKFAKFISDSDSEITSSPESLSRLSNTINLQLQRAAKAEQKDKKAWIARSQAKRDAFAETAKNTVSKIREKFKTKEELINAIQTGLLGEGAQRKFQLQFRNKSADELSESDLRSIIEDQELLEILKKSKQDK